VQRERNGRLSRCELDAANLKDAAEWLDAYRAFWTGQLDALAQYMERKQR